MITREFLLNLRAADVAVKVVGDKLQLDMPEAVLTDDLLNTIREHKAELLALFTTQEFCPACSDKLDLQDRARDVWWCANCRLWIIEGTVQ